MDLSIGEPVSITSMAAPSSERLQIMNTVQAGIMALIVGIIGTAVVDITMQELDIQLPSAATPLGLLLQGALNVLFSAIIGYIGFKFTEYIPPLSGKPFLKVDWTTFAIAIGVSIAADYTNRISRLVGVRYGKRPARRMRPREPRRVVVPQYAEQMPTEERPVERAGPPPPMATSVRAQEQPQVEIAKEVAIPQTAGQETGGVPKQPELPKEIQSTQMFAPESMLAGSGGSMGADLNSVYQI